MARIRIWILWEISFIFLETEDNRGLRINGTWQLLMKKVMVKFSLSIFTSLLLTHHYPREYNVM